jgi:Zn-dependent oligopeptidase
MAKSTNEVIGFLDDLKIKALKKSKKEIIVLKKYAKSKLKIKNLNRGIWHMWPKNIKKKILVFLKKSLKNIFLLKM